MAREDATRKSWGDGDWLLPRFDSCPIELGVERAGDDSCPIELGVERAGGGSIRRVSELWEKNWQGYPSSTGGVDVDDDEDDDSEEEGERGSVCKGCKYNTSSPRVVIDMKSCFCGRRKKPDSPRLPRWLIVLREKRRTEDKERGGGRLSESSRRGGRSSGRDVDNVPPDPERGRRCKRSAMVATSATAGEDCGSGTAAIFRILSSSSYPATAADFRPPWPSVAEMVATMSGEETPYDHCSTYGRNGGVERRPTFPTAALERELSSGPEERGRRRRWRGTEFCGREEDERMVEARHDGGEIAAGVEEDGGGVGAVVAKEEEEEVPGQLRLPEDLWRSVFGFVPVESLEAVERTCKLWRSILKENPSIKVAAFCNTWELAKAYGWPMSPAFWKGKLSQFVISHRLERDDTIASLAIKYGVQVPDIKRQNNMISDHAIHVRECLLIPIKNAETLKGKTCYIELDCHAQREVAVIYLNGDSPSPSHHCHSAKSSSSASRQAHARDKRMKKRLVEVMMRSMHVDEATAAYYLESSNCDMRQGYAEFLRDLKWEHSQPTNRLW